MAKQAVGPFIRYLDKAVLGACAALFLYFVAVYGVLSPNKAESEGAQVGPGEVDSLIRTEADRLRDKLLSAEPPPIPEEENLVIPDLRRLDDPLALAQVPPRLPSPVPPGLPVPKGPADAVQKVVELAEVIALQKPRVITGRSGVYLSDPAEFRGGQPPTTEDASTLQDSNWATVYAVFDRAAQERLFAEAGYAEPRAVVLGIDLQRRMQQPGGTWTEWSDVRTVSRMALTEYPQPQVELTPKGIYTVSDDEREDVDEFLELITKGENNEAQCDLMRPLFPLTEYGDPWVYPKDVELDILAQDAEAQKESRCRYPECAETVTTVDSQLDYSDLMKEAERELTDGKLSAALAYAEAALGKAAVGSRDANKAEELIDKIKREQARVQQAATYQERLPQLVVWAHDAGATNLLSGRTYQYRARLRLFNNYCAKPTLLKEPLKAAQVELVGPWSEPSDPKLVPPDTAIFVRSARAAKQEVKVEVFKWFAGNWRSSQFSVTVGDPIGEPKTERSTGGSVDERTLVDYSTGAVVIDIDFRRRVALPARKTGKLETMETTALVYVDASGNLHENFLDLDKDSEERKALESGGWSTR